MFSLRRLRHRAVPRPLVHARDWLWYTALGGVLLIGAGLRFYRLDAQPLWLDELYTAELVRRGLSTIWTESLVEHTRPLASLIFWSVAHLVGLSATGLRLASAMAATLALVLYAIYCVRATTRGTALLATAIMAMLPLMVYYAQEARPYALQVLCLSALLICYQGVRERGDAVRWSGYACVALLAAHIQFANLIPIAAHLTALLCQARERRRAVAWTVAIATLITISIVPFLAGAQTLLQKWNAANPPLQLLGALQTMAAGDTRIATPMARITALVALGTSALAALGARRAWSALLPHVLHIVLMVGLTFVALPAVGRTTPAFQERQFIMLIPAVALLAATGLRWLMQQRLWWLALLLIGSLTVTSANTLHTYFSHFTKSPEGVLAGALADAATPNDAVVSLHDAYSVDAAVQFYAPDLAVFRVRQIAADVVWLAAEPSLLESHWFGTHPPVPATELHRFRRIWIVQRHDEVPPALRTLVAAYQYRQSIRVSPFTAHLYERP